MCSHATKNQLPKASSDSTSCKHDPQSPSCERMMCIWGISNHAMCDAGANVRQQHNSGIVLYFDVQLQWAAANQQATVYVQADGNRNWNAQKAVVAPAEGDHVHTVQVLSIFMLQSVCHQFSICGDSHRLLAWDVKTSLGMWQGVWCTCIGDVWRCGVVLSLWSQLIDVVAVTPVSQPVSAFWCRVRSKGICMCADEVNRAIRSMVACRLWQADPVQFHNQSYSIIFISISITLSITICIIRYTGVHIGKLDWQQRSLTHAVRQLHRYSRQTRCC